MMPRSDDLQMPDPSGILTLDLGKGPRDYVLFDVNALSPPLRARLLRHYAKWGGDETLAGSEAAVDAADLRDAEAALAAPRSAFLSDAAMQRLLNDEPPLEVLAEERGLSQKELADLAGLSQAYVSQMAAGQRKGSLAAWRALAKALQVDLELLLPDAA